MKECANCGMPMVKAEDFGGNNPKNALCRKCYVDKSDMGFDLHEKKDEEEELVSSGGCAADIDDFLHGR